MWRYCPHRVLNHNDRRRIRFSNDDDTLRKNDSVTDYAIEIARQIKGTFMPIQFHLNTIDMDMYLHKSETFKFFETSNCHQIGVFSRCDTFKTI